MMKRKKYDIFISYRRKGGYTTAKHYINKFGNIPTTNIPYITPENANAPNNLMQSVKTDVSLEYIKEHFGEPKNIVSTNESTKYYYWEFKNITLRLGEKDNGNFEIYFGLKGEANMFFDDIISDFTQIINIAIS